MTKDNSKAAQTRRKDLAVHLQGERAERTDVAQLLALGKRPGRSRKESARLNDRITLAAAMERHPAGKGLG